MKNEPYSLFKKYKKTGLKAVEIITDHQAVLRSNVGHKIVSHSGLMKEIEKEIYPTLTGMEIDDREFENVCIFISDDQVIVHFPDDGKFSLNQFQFILDFVKSVSLYNHEVSSRDRIPIEMDWVGRGRIIYDIHEIDESVAKQLKRCVRKPKELDRERLIGDISSLDNDRKK